MVVFILYTVKYSGGSEYTKNSQKIAIIFWHIDFSGF